MAHSMKIRWLLGATGLIVAFQACGGKMAVSSNSSYEKSSMGGTTADNPKATLGVYLGSTVKTANDVTDVSMCIGQSNYMGYSQFSSNTSTSASPGSSATASATASASSSISSLPGSSASGSASASASSSASSSSGTSASASASASAFSYATGSPTGGLPSTPSTIADLILWQATPLTNFNLQFVPAGSRVQTITVENSMLTAVELQLANSCGTSSFRFTNSHGTFQTTRALSLKFIGKMTLSGSAPPIQLDLAPVLEALKYAKSAADVDRILQTVTGSF